MWRDRDTGLMQLSEELILRMSVPRCCRIVEPVHHGILDTRDKVILGKACLGWSGQARVLIRLVC